MTALDKIRSVKNQLQDELKEESNPRERNKLVIAINALFDVITKGESE